MKRLLIAYHSRGRPFWALSSNRKEHVTGLVADSAMVVSAHPLASGRWA